MFSPLSITLIHGVNHAVFIDAPLTTDQAELPCESLPADPGMTPRLGYDPATTALMQRLHPTPAAAASPIAGSPHCLVVLPMLLGVEAPDRDAHHEWQWAARAVATRDQIIAARIERSPQRFTHRGEFDKFGVDLGQLHPRAGLQPCISPLAGAKAADLPQVRDLVQRENQPLCCLDHPQHRDCGGRIHAVTTERSIRLMQQTRRS